MCLTPCKVFCKSDDGGDGEDDGGDDEFTASTAVSSGLDPFPQVFTVGKQLDFM